MKFQNKARDDCSYGNKDGATQCNQYGYKFDNEYEDMNDNNNELRKRKYPIHVIAKTEHNTGVAGNATPEWTKTLHGKCSERIDELTCRHIG